VDYAKRAYSIEEILQLKSNWVVPGAGFEPATSGHRAFGHHLCSPDYESGALARLGFPGNACFVVLSC
jgi:hypothetical protein